MGITVAFWWGTRTTFKYCACYWRSRDGKGRRNVATSSKSRGENESASRHQTIDPPPEQTLTLVKVLIIPLGCVSGRRIDRPVTESHWRSSQRSQTQSWLVPFACCWMCRLVLNSFIISQVEEAVQDVKRATMAELQRALAAERTRADRLMAESRRQGADETLLVLGRHSQAKEVVGEDLH